MLKLPGLFGSQPENCCKFSIVRCSPSPHKMLHNSSVSSLHQCGFFHIISSLLVFTHHHFSSLTLLRRLESKCFRKEEVESSLQVPQVFTRSQPQRLTISGDMCNQRQGPPACNQALTYFLNFFPNSYRTDRF